MMHTLALSFVLFAIAVGQAQSPATQPDSGRPAVNNWPAFRGPTPGYSTPASGRPPISIDPTRHVRWRVPVPAAGQSSPIIWGNRIFLTGENHRVMAFDRATGKLLFNTAIDPPAHLDMPGDDEFTVHADDTGQAAPTVATDGQRVYAFFGSSVLAAVDFEGKQVWAERLVVGKPRNTFGLAASPVLYDGLVIQQVDLGKEPEDNLSFIVALRAKDGTQAWRKDREVKSSWTTPLLARLGDSDTLITTAAYAAIAYDPKTGEERWRAEELSGDAAASAIICDGLVLALGGEGGQILAIRPGGKGDVTGSHVAWSRDLPMPDVASPVSDGKSYFHITSSGKMLALDPKTGKTVRELDEMRGVFWASPVIVDGRIYAINYDGVIYVVSADGLKILAQSKLGEKVTATPAILDGRIYVRTEKHLLCIEQ